LKTREEAIPARDWKQANKANTDPCSALSAKRDAWLRQMTTVKPCSQPRHIPVRIQNKKYLKQIKETFKRDKLKFATTDKQN